MSDFYDRYEHRPPGSRESALLRDLRGILSVGRSRASTLRSQLKGIVIDSLKTRANLAQIPILRKSDLRALQKDHPPFGGACTTRPGALMRLLVSHEMVCYPEGQAKDWWGAARALYAAGIRKGDLILSCFSDHALIESCMIEAGARALGCPVIPMRPTNIELLLDTMAYLQPAAFCGEAESLKLLVETAAALGQKPMPLRHALLLGRGVPPILKKEITAFGLDVYEAYAFSDLGIVAFESAAHEGLIVNEGLLVEIVRPGTNEPVSQGEVGEVVVTRLNADYPLLRFGTEDLSAMLRGPSPCGRTNMRLAGSMGAVSQPAQFDGTWAEGAEPDKLAQDGKIIHREKAQWTVVPTQT
jgi:phenylacetate-CoA ligase